MGRLLRALLLGAAVLVVTVVAYLCLWPVSIEPVAWEAPEAPTLVGPHALNDDLSRGRRLAEGFGIGPEDVAFDSEGRLYTGFEGGAIVRLNLPDGRAEVMADTGGRPLGMVFDGEGQLLVADARAGLLSVSPTGEIDVLATGVDGQPFGFLDDLDVSPGGVVYMSDASRGFGYGQHDLAILQHGGDGRLLAYDPADGSVHVVLDGLQFPNGVVLAPSGEFLYLAETGLYRVLRVWLVGERAGTWEVFADNLPGFPDNIAATPRGGLWAPLSSPRHPVVDGLAPWPFLRKVVARLPDLVRPDALRHGLVVELDSEGSPARTLHSPSGDVAFTSCAMERDGVLYVGSFRDPWIVAVPLD